MAKRAGHIPLDAIPRKPKLEKGARYPLAFRQKAVELMRSISAADVATKTGVTPSILYTWRKELDPMFELREGLERAESERLARLEQCAFVLEHDGPDGKRIAEVIRAHARGDHYIRLELRRREKVDAAMRKAVKARPGVR